MAYPKKNTAFVFDVTLTMNNSLVVNPTLAIGDVTVSTDEGAFGNLTTLPTVTPASGVNVKVSASTTEMNGDRMTIRFKDQTSPPEWDEVYFTVLIPVVNVDDLVRSTTPANTFDVSATGEGGLDFNNIKDATGSHTLTNIIIPRVTLTDTITTYTGNTPQTGDNFVRIGAAGVALTAVGLANGAITTAKFAAGAIDTTVLATDAKTAIATAVMASVVEGTITLKQMQQVLGAMLGGKVSGADTGTVTVRNASDTVNALVITQDATGRLTVTFTFT